MVTAIADEGNGHGENTGNGDATTEPVVDNSGLFRVPPVSGPEFWQRSPATSADTRERNRIELNEAHLGALPAYFRLILRIQNSSATAEAVDGLRRSARRVVTTATTNDQLIEHFYAEATQSIESFDRMLLVTTR